MRGTLLVDTDPGLGLPWADVDDALAIAHLVASGVAVAGLTTCFGNTSLGAVSRCARDLGRRLGLEVYPGARWPGDVRSAATERLLHHEGTVLALAPLTNIAAALERGARWERLIVLGGTDRRLPNLRPLHTTELNLALDEPAACVALDACTDLVPMEVCRTVWFDASDLAPAPAWLRDGCAHWLRTSPMRTGRRAFHPWDLVAAMWVTDAGLFEADAARPILSAAPLWRGRIRWARGQARVVRAVDDAILRRTWRERVRGLV